MGQTCSKKANAAALEERRIDRERRLGILPACRPNLTCRSHPEARENMSLNLSQSHAPIGQRTSPLLDNRPGMSHMHPKRGLDSSTSLIGRASRNTAARPSPQLFPLGFNAHTPTQPGMHLPATTTQPPLSYMGGTRPKRLDWVKQGANVQRNGGDKMHQGFVKEDTKITVKPKIKPVVRLALNLLCAEEIQCRAEISTEAMAKFKSLEEKLASINELEAVRISGLELLKLQSKSREAIVEQEMGERRLLFFWMNQTLEEDRLKDLIDAAQRRHNTSMSSFSSTSNRGSRVSATYDRQSVRTNKMRNKSLMERPVYHEHDNEEATTENVSLKKAIDYSTPDLRRIAPAEEDIQSDDLNRKIGRQMYLMRQTIPSCSSQSLHLVPDASSNNLCLSKERPDPEFRPLEQGSPPRLANLPEEERSVSYSRSTFLDPFKTPRGRTPIELKNESDLAMKRRLAALLMV
ncbi:uncharacterized protein Tco025E_06134 [Trypanosoma conorhini]|uniref:Uncharacterized protein n=1 Tax=Trypanosoma conorhini TaxID=83891 RepID=A0A3R7N7T6_9TRYP|nr:uncharacterized protein Tco025E_06134 [Trypanosoma conorhini]RNF14241.1 hypothetical protein Tco025E_06134 [Trypanosoma conorhini]